MSVCQYVCLFLSGCLPAYVCLPAWLSMPVCWPVRLLLCLHVCVCMSVYQPLSVCRCLVGWLANSVWCNSIDFTCLPRCQFVCPSADRPICPSSDPSVGGIFSVFLSYRPIIVTNKIFNIYLAESFVWVCQLAGICMHNLASHTSVLHL